MGYILCSHVVIVVQSIHYSFTGPHLPEIWHLYRHFFKQMLFSNNSTRDCSILSSNLLFWVDSLTSIILPIGLTVHQS